MGPVLLGLAWAILAKSAPWIRRLWRASLAPRTPQELGAVADQVAAAVEEQWRAEVAHRSLNDPHPLPVRWDGVTTDLVQDWGTVVELARHGAGWPPAREPSTS